MPMLVCNCFTSNQQLHNFIKGIREVFQKCIEYIVKLLIHIREIFQMCKKLYALEEIFGLISEGLPDDQKWFNVCSYGNTKTVPPFKV